MIDWNKPIEFVKHNGTVVPARVICKDRRTPGNTHCILYVDGAYEANWNCQANGEDAYEVSGTKARVRNVKEKKKYWSYITINKVNPGQFAPLNFSFNSDQLKQVGDKIGGETIINIIEGEYEV